MTAAPWLSRLLNTMRWTALGMVAWPLATILVATAAFGMTAVVIDGGSMHPALRRGDVVLAERHPNNLEPGQVVMFDVGSGRTTHRLIELTDAGWITAGDANRQADSDPVRPSEITGLGKFVLPYVGWGRTEPAFAGLAIGLFAAIGVILRSRVKAEEVRKP